MSNEDRQTVQQVYADKQEEYDRVRLHDPRGRLVSNHDLWIFAQLFPRDCAEKSVVELGAGTGRFTLAALERVAQLVATDINEAMLESLRRKLDTGGCAQRCTTRVEDIFNLSFEDQSIDCVFAIHVIPRFLELEDQRMAIREVARTMKPGGRFLFNFSNRSSIYGILSRRHVASWGQMKKMLADAGLRVVARRGKWLVNRSVTNILPLPLGRLLAAVDRTLVRFWPGHAWDVFVLAVREDSGTAASRS